MSNPNTDRDERVDPELDALSWNPTAEEADAYLRGHGVIKKCEHCGQDATLTNDFVSHLLTRFGERMREVDNAATRMRDRCVAVATDFQRMSGDNFWRKYGTAMLVDALESLTLEVEEKQ